MTPFTKFCCFQDDYKTVLNNDKLIFDNCKIRINVIVFKTTMLNATFYNDLIKIINCVGALTVKLRVIINRVFQNDYQLFLVFLGRLLKLD